MSVSFITEEEAQFIEAHLDLQEVKAFKNLLSIQMGETDHAGAAMLDQAIIDLRKVIRENTLDNTIKLTTKWDNKGLITQELLREAGDPAKAVVEVMATWVINTREKSLREALVALGWTPPDNGKGDS